MALIRSEHINDQAVKEAKESISTAENALEEARAQLERRERAQYHEEQIWSDTIRRNSTWVTFGLMGLNIFLLLSSLVIFEPWRRRRMVREVKNALEAHKVSLEPAVTTLPTIGTAPSSQNEQNGWALRTVMYEVGADKRAELDETIQNEENHQETTAIIVEPIVSNPPTQREIEAIAEENPQTQGSLLDTITEPDAPGVAPLTSEEVVPQNAINIEEEVKTATDVTPKTWHEKISYVAQDVISDRLMSIRRVDFTTAMLQSAAAGAVIAAAAIAMLRLR
jgi:sensitive to high expression protein 9